MFCNDGATCQLALESNHRIANHAAMLGSYVALRRREFTNLSDLQEGPDILRLLDGIAAQVAAMSELHRMLTNNTSIHSGDINAQLGRLCDAFQKGPASGTTIEYSGESGCILPMDQILPVSQIVSEVVTNALKYGHKAGSEGAIRVRCQNESPNRIRISIEDDGDGVSPGVPPVKKPKGIGSALVANLVRQVDGQMDYLSSNSGLLVSLSLPSAEHRTSERNAMTTTYQGSRT